jgi:hypothetical protein
MDEAIVRAKASDAARVDLIDRSVERSPCARRCRRTEARNAARGPLARAKISTEKELCSSVQWCASAEKDALGDERPRSLLRDR